MKNLDVFEVRRVNLKTIIDQQFAGVQRGLAANQILVRV
ncbi:hypothetical protein MELB17_09503 [Marinobacter sp. ELB17]|nr:hypothetical protein MELB17_09503 [Marinobacter sp. ELB17]